MPPRLGPAPARPYPELAMAGRLLPVALALASVASAAVAVVPPLVDRPPRRPATIRAATPVFSVRRAPELATRVVADGRLRAQLEAVLAAPDLASSQACLTVTDPDGLPVFAYRGGARLVPASTMKVLTGATVLSRMGPDTRYRTEVRAVGGPALSVAQLWLVGSGDPLLATADFAAVAGWMETPRPFTSMEELADRVVAAGIRSVGRVVGDESRYDTQRYIPSWKVEYATNPEVGPQSALAVNGGFVQWRPRAIPADAPALHAAGVLAGLLRARGVSVGATAQGAAPTGATVVAAVESLPMTEVVAVVMRDSDNLGAELLVKELGARFGSGGTTAAGLAVVRDEVDRLGPGLAAGYVGVDGSGLDRSNRLSCDILHAVLSRSGDGGPIEGGMAEAGRSGTLLRRFLGTEAAGRVRAKTGSLDEVIGLAGWATGRDGRDLEFALIANGLPYDALGFWLQDQVVVALARYPQAPPPDEVAPLPAVAAPPAVRPSPSPAGPS